MHKEKENMKNLGHSMWGQATFISENEWFSTNRSGRFRKKKKDQDKNNIERNRGGPGLLQSGEAFIKHYQVFMFICFFWAAIAV